MDGLSTDSKVHMASAITSGAALGLYEGADEIKKQESLQVDFVTLKNPTHNISDANKHGEGGFGLRNNFVDESQGMDLYFKRHDGQAVTCEELTWYSQAGTPSVKVTSSYNAEAQTFSLKFTQEVPPTPGQDVKEPMFIHVSTGILDSNGKDMPLTSVYHDGTLRPLSTNGEPVYTTVLRVTKKEEEFVFSDISQRPVPSLVRGYSAPIRLNSDLTDNDLFLLRAHDSDEFNRWEAGQVLARNLMLSLVAEFQQNKPLALNAKFFDGLRSILCDSSLDKEFIAKAITLPGEGEIMDMMTGADPDAVHAICTFSRKQISSQLKPELLKTVENNKSSEPYVFDDPNVSRRALKNTAIVYLASPEDSDVTELALHEYNSSTIMTEQFAALAAIVQIPGKARDDALADFYSKWEHDYLVVNKWFALQAMSDIPGNVENVQKLVSHPAFDMCNPNKVFSLIGALCGSPVNFHAKDGSGYKFLGEIVVQVDKLNPQGGSDALSVRLGVAAATGLGLLAFTEVVLLLSFAVRSILSAIFTAYGVCSISLISGMKFIFADRNNAPSKTIMVHNRGGMRHVISDFLI